ncbi:Uncharacterized protein TCM_046147 [Theobroma cacao]|uniref:Uncharacterized protein n=1 Tax=Theobroma cacao TaxID=3641 RepID=S1SIQ0_THECC|nr:Uncharacterized protein TCM_046147 [Theobroma cacao]
MEEKVGLGGDEEEEETEIEAPAWFFPTIIGTACCLSAVLAGILFWQTRNYMADRAVKGQSNETDDLSGYYYIVQHVFGFSFLVVMAVEFALLTNFMIMCSSVAATDPISDVEMPADQPGPRIASVSCELVQDNGAQHPALVDERGTMMGRIKFVANLDAEIPSWHKQ